MSNNATILRELFRRNHYVSVADARQAIGSRAPSMLDDWQKNGQVRSRRIEGCGGVRLYELVRPLPHAGEPHTHPYLTTESKAECVLVYLREHPWSTLNEVKTKLGKTEASALTQLLDSGKVYRFRVQPAAAYRWALVGEPISDSFRAKGVTDSHLETGTNRKKHRRRKGGGASGLPKLDGIEGLQPFADELMYSMVEQRLDNVDRDLCELDQALLACRAEEDAARQRRLLLEERKKRLTARREALASKKKPKRKGGR